MAVRNIHRSYQTNEVRVSTRMLCCCCTFKLSRVPMQKVHPDLLSFLRSHSVGTQSGEVRTVGEIVGEIDSLQHSPCWMHNASAVILPSSPHPAAYWNSLRPPWMGCRSDAVCRDDATYPSNASEPSLWSSRKMSRCVASFAEQRGPFESWIPLLPQIFRKAHSINWSWYRFAPCTGANVRIVHVVLHMRASR